MQFPCVQKASLRLWLALSLVMVCLVAIGLLGVRATHADSDPGPSPGNDLPQNAKTFSAMPGEVIVRFRTAAPEALATIKGERQFQSLAAADGRQISMSIERLDHGAELIEGLRLVHVTADDTLSAIETLRSRPDVVYAEPNFVRRKSIVPNDPRYGEMWNLKNTGQQQTGIAGDDIGAEPAWDVTTGNRQIVVGVVDEGIDINHPDLKDNIWKNPGEIPGNGIDDDGNGYVDDINGWDFAHNDATVFDGNGTYPTDQTDAHGTHVAGTIGATGNNGTGVVGVNWQVSLMSLKFIDSSGTGTTAQLLKAFSYAKSMRDTWVSSGGVKGANLRILNNSYGGAGFSQAELDAIRALNDSNILFVAAAGNDKQDNDRFPHYPANYDSPNVISVGASTPADAFAPFSNFGSRTVHVAAPGVNILSTTPNGTYDIFSGTSMAAPHVAGVAALLCASHPGLSIQRLKAALIFGGDEKSNFFNGSFSGCRLSANGSLQNASQNDSVPPATITGLHITSQSARSVTLQWTATGDDGANGKAAAYDLRFSDSDISTASQFDHARPLAGPHPNTAGTQETVTISVPYQHLNGYVGIRAIDDVGNAGGIAEMPIVVSTDIGAPYIVSEGPAASLSTGGTALNLKGDDRASNAYPLPFSFNYYGQNYSSVYLTTNGALYFAPPPVVSNPPPPENAGDADSSIAGLNAYQMIAGVWDDLRTDRRPGDDIYVTTPDADRIIFRWQAVTFDTPLPDGTQRGENPVSFEIELRRDGTIQIRYGNDNHRLKPVVGISSANPDAYVSLSHTSESVLTDLTNAPAITFALRNPPPPPSADLQVSMSASPDLLLSGQNITYFMVVRNNGPNDAPNVVFKDQLPAGANFVSCQTGSGSCVASNGTVTVNLGTQSYPSNGVFVQIVANVTAPAGTKLVNTATVTSTLLDNNNANNSISTSTDVFAPTVFSGVKAIAAGADFTLATTADGSLWAWGFNALGQLGDGTKNDASTPRQVAGLSGAVSLAPGNGFTVVALSDGTVWSWGVNDYGQLGDGSTTAHLLPARVTGLSDVVTVGTGSFFSVALKKDGTVWGWGAGYMFGSNVNIKTPIQITNLANIKAISACGNHVLALQPDGSVWAWGSNSMGELGDGTTTFRSSPVPVTGLTGVVSISSGAITGDDDYSLALRSDGTVWAWGSNLSLQLGLPYQGLTPHPVPGQVNGITGAMSISAGGHHGVVLRNDGTVWTWGDSNHLQLGHCCANTPDQVPGLVNIQAVAGGSYHTVVLLADGSLRSWGSNTSGQLGDATTLNRANPVAVTGLSAVGLPAFSPDGGQYPAAQTVRVSCPTDGSTVHYTLNNNDPTQDDPVIACGSSVGIGSGKITVLKAKAWKQGMVSSPVKSATYNIFSANPIDDPPPFVRQHYFDFLSRAADQAGLDFWISQITSCGGDAACTEVKRINVSGAFFLSIEFQQTGYLVERMYKVAYGDAAGNSTFGGQHQLPVPVIRLSEFLADTQRVGRGVVVLQPGWEQALENNKQAYTFEFVQTSRFTAANAFPTTMTPAQFVDKLNQNAGSVLSASERAAAIDLFTGAADTTNLTARVTALRQIAEDADLYRAEFNRAFVLAQYVGYLRRNPNDAPEPTLDYSGYDFWLTKLNQFNGDYVAAEMVKAFIASSEYRKRFGP